LNPMTNTATTTAAPPPTMMARRLVSNSSGGDSKLERAARAIAAASANESVWGAPDRPADEPCGGSNGGDRSKGGNRTGGSLLVRARLCRLPSDVSEGEGAAPRTADGPAATRVVGGPAAPFPRGRCPAMERTLCDGPPRTALRVILCAGSECSMEAARGTGCGAGNSPDPSDSAACSASSSASGGGSPLNTTC
jgi:hypothetical protein